MFSSTNKPTGHGLLFFGNQHETVPTRLLQDPALHQEQSLLGSSLSAMFRPFKEDYFPLMRRSAKCYPIDLMRRLNYRKKS